MQEKPTLNQAQQEAVSYADGPLLIIAGAGTGKTTVVTEKIVYLIESGAASPEQILALTFTDKASAEMQDRVDTRLNTGYADLQISTFHTFCQRLLEEYGLDIGLPNRFTLMTDTDAWILLRQHIFSLPLNYYRPLGNPARHIEELLRHFSKCKDELITPADYRSYAEQILLDNDETGEIEKSRLIEIADVYHAYNQLLLDRNTLDFGDLIRYSIELLRERPQVQKAIHERYRYVLVDEFQDVNWAQYQLTKLLSAHGQLTVVGDDDQSIYAFRGASVSNILRFKDDFPHAKEIVLTENYRSGQKILDSAYALIKHNNPDRLEAKLNIEKRLKSRIIDKGLGRIEHLHCASIDDEVRTVVETITKIKKENTDAVWDDFAILVRANNHAEPFVRALDIRSIPYEFLASSGLFRQPIVLDCMSFFSAVMDRLDSSAWYRLLRMPCVRVTENDIQRITAAARKKSMSYYETIKRGSEFHISPTGQDEMERVVSFVHAGMRMAKYEKPTTVLYHFLDSSGYLTFLAHEEGQGNLSAIRSIYHLKQFFDVLARFEEVVPGANVALFVEHMEQLRDAGNEGKLYQPSDTPDSVNILTIHAAKGLEFRFVFIVNLVEDRFPTRRRGEGIDIPSPLIKERLPEGDYHVEEERRLMYVAMTRAKERLYLLSAEDYGGTRSKKISRFLLESGLAEIKLTSSENKSGVDGLKVVQKVERVTDPHGFVYEPPATFSFSQIRAYETCPYQYKLAHILHIPTRGNASFSFGKTIHSTLQHFYERVQEMNESKQTSLFGEPNPDEKTGGIKVPTLDDLLKIYDESWIPDWYESRHQREAYHKKGKEILQIFYAAQDGAWTVPVALENGFKIRVGDTVLRGQIDRIDRLEDNTLEIVDYKTGKSKKTLAYEDKEQLFLYQIAADILPEYRTIGTPSKLTFYYINDNARVSFLGKNNDLEKLKDKILTTVSAIRRGDFTATPSPHVCGHCDFRDICEFRIL